MRHAESAGTVAPGTLRFEAECRKGWLRTNGQMATLGELREDRVLELARNRWEWSRLGVEVAVEVSELVTGVRGIGLSGVPALQLIGWMVAQGLGGGLGPGSRTTESKLRSQARQVGLVLSSGLLGLEFVGLISIALRSSSLRPKAAVMETAMETPSMKAEKERP